MVSFFLLLTYEVVGYILCWFGRIFICCILSSLHAVPRFSSLDGAIDNFVHDVLARVSFSGIGAIVFDGEVIVMLVFSSDAVVVVAC